MSRRGSRGVGNSGVPIHIPCKPDAFGPKPCVVVNFIGDSCKALLGLRQAGSAPPRRGRILDAENQGSNFVVA